MTTTEELEKMKASRWSRIDDFKPVDDKDDENGDEEDYSNGLGKLNRHKHRCMALDLACKICLEIVQ